MAAPPGRTLAELASRQGRSEEATLELLRPLIRAGLVGWRGGRLVVVDALVAAAFTEEEGARELLAQELPLAARVSAYLARNRSRPYRRRTAAIVEGVRCGKDALRELLEEDSAFVDEGSASAHTWGLAAWRSEERAS